MNKTPRQIVVVILDWIFTKLKNITKEKKYNNKFMNNKFTKYEKKIRQIVVF